MGYSKQLNAGTVWRDRDPRRFIAKPWYPEVLTARETQGSFTYLSGLGTGESSALERPWKEMAFSLWTKRGERFL